MTDSIALKNLYDPAISKRKGIENEKKILNFLLKEKYSISSILQDILGIKTRSAICKILNRMIKKGYLKRHDLSMYKVLWGITNDGLHEAQISLNKIEDWQYFEPSKVNPLTVDHQLDIQRIHANSIKLDLEFTTGREMGSRADSDKIPDGIIQIGDKKIALEVERHVKSRRRYDAVIYNYLKMIKSGEYYSVLYASDTEVKTQKIKRAITSIEKITMKINGRNQDLKMTPAHLSYFDFVPVAGVYDYLLALKSGLISSDSL